MDVSSTIRPVEAYRTKTLSATVVSKPLGKSSPSGNPEKHEIERYRHAKADTAQSIADDIKKFMASRDVRLEISVDKNTDEIKIRMVRSNSQIIKEIPGGVVLGDIGTIDQMV